MCGLRQSSSCGHGPTWCQVDTGPGSRMLLFCHTRPWEGTQTPHWIPHTLSLILACTPFLPLGVRLPFIHISEELTASRSPCASSVSPRGCILQVFTGLAPSHQCNFGSKETFPTTWSKQMPSASPSSPLSSHLVFARLHPADSMTFVCSQPLEQSKPV